MNIDRETQTIQLQGIGRCPAIAAEQLQPGMILSWNYSPRGYAVVSVAPKGKQSLTVVERNRETGKEYTRTLRKTRLVVAEPE